MSLFTFGNDAAATLQALGHSLAVIEFNTDGTILDANENFCRAFGYSTGELKGQHHSLFCDPAFVKSAAYKALWEKLARGEYDAQEYRRIAKGGREAWIQATYNPVRSRSGKVQKVVKIATDITPQKLKAISDAGQLSAIHRAQAVIDFTVDGVVLDANENFCKTLGYTIEDIRGRHHRMFCEPAYAQSPDYVTFWRKLARGEFDAREYKRIGNGGKEVWIQASYNPIFDTDGKVVKVVKFATDVTDRVKAVDALAGALSQLAAGNLDQQLTLPFPPALEQLRADFNASVQSLHGVVSQVRQTAHAVETGTGEIREASSNLSKRTEQQAASLEETAAALEEITATVNKTAEGTRQAHAAIGDAKSGAERSGQVVEKAVAAMSSIESSSREVNQIIGVIDEIAFQTNLLALNAGVEAARAGDAGRGFAVVASEVRALAQRSAEAAKQIKELILQSTTHVATGVDLVASTGRALQEIIGQVNEVAGIIGDINAAASEQATSLGQVNTAINQLDQITQQNAAMVEQSSAASTAINDKARELNTLLSRFALGAHAKPMAFVREVAHLAPIRRSEPARRTKGSARAAPKPLVENEWTDF